MKKKSVYRFKVGDKVRVKVLLGLCTMPHTISSVPSNTSHYTLDNKGFMVQTDDGHGRLWIESELKKVNLSLKEVVKRMLQ